MLFRSDPILLARPNGKLFSEAKSRNLDVRPLTFMALRSLARKVDLVHTHDAKAHAMAAVAGGAPIVVSRRVGFPVHKGWMSRWKYDRAEMFLAVSRFVAQRLEEAGVEPEVIRVVYDGVPIPEDPSLPGSGRVVVLANKPADIPGVVTERTEDLWKSLVTASVFVYKSQLEGQGSAALAAMACGVPVVASAVGGLVEAVQHGRTGYLVHDGDYAKPVRKLLADPLLAALMGATARERAQREFSVEVMVKNTKRCYRETLGMDAADESNDQNDQEVAAS